jgi:hypothetical protein
VDAKCPKCDAELITLKAEHVHAADGVFSQIPATIFMCPNCKAFLGVAYRPPLRSDDVRLRD